MVDVDWDGIHLMWRIYGFIFISASLNKSTKIKKQGIIYYPSGTLLWSHRCVQLTPELGMTSSFVETVWGLPSSFILPKNSVKPIKGLIGVAGELSETTEGGEVKDAGASTVNVRSSDVKFEAWRVRTW